MRPVISRPQTVAHYIAGTKVSHEYGLMMRAEAGGPGGVAEGLIYPAAPRVGQELAILDVLEGTGDDPTLLAWQPGEYLLQTTRGEVEKASIKTVPAPVEIAGPWEVRFPKGWGAPSSRIFDRLKSWTEDTHQDIKHFSGTATYHKEFTLPANLTGRDLHLALDLGEVKNIADVWLNGHHVGIFWKPPFRADIGKVIKPGNNTLKIEITNLWRNRLIGDANLPKEQRLTNTNIVIPKDAPKSGKDTPTSPACSSFIKASTEARIVSCQEPFLT